MVFSGGALMDVNWMAWNAWACWSMSLCVVRGKREEDRHEQKLRAEKRQQEKKRQDVHVAKDVDIYVENDGF